MALQLYTHPLSSYCQKVSIALHELALPFEAIPINLADTAQREAFVQLWPTGKIPLLVDDGQVVPETSVMIEHLTLQHAPASTLLPLDPGQCLQVRLWDRLLDLYVMTPVQTVVAQHLRDAASRDEQAVSSAKATLAMAWVMLENQLAEQEAWLAGPDFTLADCAAAPALFYAVSLVPFAADQPLLQAYFERLVSRPSVQHVLAEAQPWLTYYPFHAGIAERFKGGSALQE
jgi:glutathione S-transferase